MFKKISQNFVESPLKFCLISQFSVHSLWHVCIDNVLFCSVFQNFHRKNDSLKSLNPEGTSGSYLCDVILPAILIMCQFLFCGTKKVNKDFYQVKKIYIFFLFSGLFS